MKYERFDDWFWETEGFATRGERFFEEFKHMDDKRALDWLKSAWECARQEPCPYCTQPELSEIMFDQNCTGCIKRMNKIAREINQSK